MNKNRKSEKKKISFGKLAEGIFPLTRITSEISKWHFSASKTIREEHFYVLEGSDRESEMHSA
jgi:hypothetical protein